MVRPTNPTTNATRCQLKGQMGTWCPPIVQEPHLIRSKDQRKKRRAKKKKRRSGIVEHPYHKNHHNSLWTQKGRMITRGEIAIWVKGSTESRESGFQKRNFARIPHSSSFFPSSFSSHSSSFPPLLSPPCSGPLLLPPLSLHPSLLSPSPLLGSVPRVFPRQLGESTPSFVWSTPSFSSRDHHHHHLISDTMR